LEADRDDHRSTRTLLGLIVNGGYLGFFCAQFFASMTRGVLWGGTLLLYATFIYNVGAEVLGGLATASSIIGIPITLCCGYLMDRFGRKTTMVPGFTAIALALFFIASSAYWRLGLTAFIAGFLWVQASHSVTSGSMQVVGSDMAPAAARGRFFGFWRLIGEIGGLVSPALFAFVAEKIAYGAAFTLFAFCALATAVLLRFSIKDITGKKPS
jgi:MFS family permease